MIRENINSYVKILGNVKKKESCSLNGKRVTKQVECENCRTLYLDFLAMFRYSDYNTITETDTEKEVKTKRTPFYSESISCAVYWDAEGAEQYFWRGTWNWMNTGPSSGSQRAL